MKNVLIGTLVSVPDRIIFPNRRDPYEWENGIVKHLGKNKKGQIIAAVRIWNHFTKQSYEKWFLLDTLKKPSFYHMIDEEDMFMNWVKNEN